MCEKNVLTEVKFIKGPFWTNNLILWIVLGFFWFWPWFIVPCFFCNNDAKECSHACGVCGDKLSYNKPNEECCAKGYVGVGCCYEDLSVI